MDTPIIKKIFNNIRPLVAIFIAVTLLIFSILEFIDGSVFSGLTLSATAILSTYLILSGISNNYNSVFTIVITMIITLLSLAHVFHTTDFFDFEASKKNSDLYQQSLEIKYCPTESQPDEKLRDGFLILKDTLMKKCALQDYKNANSFISNLQKSRLLDPATGAIDTIYNQLADKKEINCIDIAKQMNVLCPGQLSL